MPAFETSVPLTITSRSIDREATLPPNGDKVQFGMHGPVAEHYGVPSVENPLPSTLDYLTASVGGCLIGTLTGSLRRAKVPVKPEQVTGTAVGHVVPDDDGVLRLRKIVVSYTVEVEEEHREAAAEVHASHAARCPNARSVTPAVEIETQLEMVSPVAA